jgi:DNA ligase-1
MLASPADLSKLKFPLLASPKFDGIRCIVKGGQALSRNLKPIPNAFVRAWLEAHVQHLDGELVVGNPAAPDCFQRTTSAVMSKDGEPDFVFYAFDMVTCDDMVGFEERLGWVAGEVARVNSAHLVGVTHVRINTLEQLNAYEAARVAEGWEGVMLRDPEGTYKQGRSTAREGGLLKVKRFADAEAVVVGFEERMHNGNAATVDALGHTERSTHKAGKTPLGDLGALVVDWHATPNGRPNPGFEHSDPVRFSIGTGFTAAQRVDIWNRRAEFLGQSVCFKYQAVGTDEAPRFPVFKAFRPDGA